MGVHEGGFTADGRAYLVMELCPGGSLADRLTASGPLSAAAVMVLLTAPAYAQTPNVNLIPELMSKSPEEKEAEALKEKAYKDSLRKIPDAKGSSDPWGTVRSTEAPKAAPASSRRRNTAPARAPARKRAAPRKAK